MEKVAPNSEFVGHSTEIIWQSKIKGTLKEPLTKCWFYTTKVGNWLDLPSNIVWVAQIFGPFI